MKKSLVFIGSWMLISGSAFAVGPVDCVKVNDETILNLFDKWNESLLTGDAKIVTDNYLKNAVLLPTVSNKVRLTEAERIDYFEHFLLSKPFGKKDGRSIIKIGCNTATDIGLYTFTFGDKSEVAARYTFTYEYDGDDWKIATHHSSVMPEG